MGGSGGTSRPRHSEGDLRRLIEKTEGAATREQYELDVSKYLDDLLRQANARDAKKTQDRLKSLTDALQVETRADLSVLFGGSVAKHTYVDGISDVDCLVILDNLSVEQARPNTLLDRFYETVLQHTLAGVTKVTKGNLAVTVTYDDGTELQLLPTLRDAGELRIANPGKNSWAKINPEAFAAALTRRNEQCNGKLVPTVKLIKTINDKLPERQRLSGYHIEALAIDIFRGYEGAATTSAMLQHFFSKAPTAVLSPIKDKTGQSIHVDDDLGAAGSRERVGLSHVLERLANRLKNANSTALLARLKELFE